MLAQLWQDGTTEKQQAARILQSLVYQDDEIIAALHELTHDRDEGCLKTFVTLLLSILREKGEKMYYKCGLLLVWLC